MVYGKLIAGAGVGFAGIGPYFASTKSGATEELRWPEDGRRGMRQFPVARSCRRRRDRTWAAVLNLTVAILLTVEKYRTHLDSNGSRSAIAAVDAEAISAIRLAQNMVRAQVAGDVHVREQLVHVQTGLHRGGLDSSEGIAELYLRSGPGRCAIIPAGVHHSAERPVGIQTEFAGGGHIRITIDQHEFPARSECGRRLAEPGRDVRDPQDNAEWSPTRGRICRAVPQVTESNPRKPR